MEEKYWKQPRPAVVCSARLLAGPAHSAGDGCREVLAKERISLGTRPGVISDQIELSGFRPPVSLCGMQ